MTPTPTPAPTTPGPAIAADVELELFYVELDGCAPCRNALAEADEAARLVRDELAARGRSLTVRIVPLHEPGQAQARGIAAPVTVHVAGVDVSLDGPPAADAACGVAGTAPRRCRSHGWDGRLFDAPPAGLIVEAIHRHLDAEPVRATPPDAGEA